MLIETIGNTTYFYLPGRELYATAVEHAPLTLNNWQSGIVYTETVLLNVDHKAINWSMMSMCTGMLRDMFERHYKINYLDKI